MGRFWRLILLFFIATSFVQIQNESKIVIRFVDFDIETFGSVPCERFENYFKEHVNEIQITNKEDKQKIKKLVEELRPSNEKVNLDTRAQVFLYNASGKIENNLCVDNFKILLNGKNTSNNERLIVYIKELIKIQNK